MSDSKNKHVWLNALVIGLANAPEVTKALNGNPAFWDFLCEMAGRVDTLTEIVEQQTFAELTPADYGSRLIQ